MGTWIVGGIVFVLLGLAAWHVVKSHKNGGCCGSCQNCKNCKHTK